MKAFASLLCHSSLKRPSASFSAELLVLKRMDFLGESYLGLKG